MRTRFGIAAGLAGAAALALSAVAIGAKPTVVRGGNVILAIDGDVAPKKLPKQRYAPITLRAGANIRTADGAQPPVAKTVTIDFDKQGRVNARGMPACRQGKIEATTTANAKAACRRAIVGKGRTTVRVAFAEQAPFTASGPLVVFNGGSRGGGTTILIHAYVNVPAPTALVTRVKVTKLRKGRFGTRALARIPTIAGGSGALTRFDLQIRKSFRHNGKKQGYLLARCRNGSLAAHGAVAFGDGTRLAGNVVRSCRPRG